MLNPERKARFARQRGSQLTSPQNRRIQHKEGSRKTHDHEKGMRCRICRPAGQERPPGWRRPDKELKIAGGGR